MNHELTEQQAAQLRRLQQYFPYRICFGVLTESGELETYAETTRRKLNRFARSGRAVFVLELNTKTTLDTPKQT